MGGAIILCLHFCAKQHSPYTQSDSQADLHFAHVRKTHALWHTPLIPWGKYRRFQSILNGIFKFTIHFSIIIVIIYSFEKFTSCKKAKLK